MREASADDDKWQALLGQLVTGRAQRGDVRLGDVLHFVDEDRDSHAYVARHPGRVDEQLDKVDLDVPGVRTPRPGRRFDPGLPPLPQFRPVRVGPQREGLEHTEKGIDPLRIAVSRSEFPHRHVQGAGERPAKRLVGPNLDLSGPPQPADRLRPHRVEQHGLADATQTGEHQAALGPAAGHSLQNDVELLQHGVPAGQLRRTLAGSGRIRVAQRIHCSDFMSPYSANRRFG